jgi:3-hydroxyacyl-CoA dehydrogenase
MHQTKRVGVVGAGLMGREIALVFALVFALAGFEVLLTDRPLLKQRVQAGYVGGRGKLGWRAASVKKVVS